MDDLKFATLNLTTFHVSIVVSKGVVFAFIADMKHQETISNTHIFLLLLFAQFLKINPKSLENLVQHDEENQRRLMEEWTVKNLDQHVEEINRYEKFSIEIQEKLPGMYQECIKSLKDIEYITDMKGEVLYGKMTDDLKETLITYGTRLKDDLGESKEFYSAKVEMVLVNTQTIYMLGYVNVLEGLICATKSTEKAHSSRIMCKNSFRIYFSNVSGDDARTPHRLYNSCRSTSEYLTSLFTPSTPKKPEPPKQPTAAYRRKQVITQKGVAKFFNPLVPNSPSHNQPMQFDLDKIQEEPILDAIRDEQNSEDTLNFSRLDESKIEEEPRVLIAMKSPDGISESILEHMEFDNRDIEISESKKRLITPVFDSLPTRKFADDTLTQGDENRMQGPSTLDQGPSTLDDTTKPFYTPVEPALPRPPGERPVNPKHERIVTLLRNGSEAAMVRIKKPEAPKPKFLRKHLSKATSLKQLNVSQLLDESDAGMLKDLGIDIFSFIDTKMDNYSEQHHRPIRSKFL